MVARTVIALGVGLIAATTLAAEPLRFVIEPDTSALPAASDPGLDSNAQPPAPTTDNAARPVRSQSARSQSARSQPARSQPARSQPARSQPARSQLASLNSAGSRRAQDDSIPPAPEEDREPAADDASAEPATLPPPQPLPSARKTKVITIVRSKPSSAELARQSAGNSESPERFDEPGSLPMPSGSPPAPQTRHLTSSTTDRSIAHALPQAARKASRIAATTDSQPGTELRKSARPRTRHLLPPTNAGAEAAEGALAAEVPGEESAQPSSTRRRGTNVESAGEADSNDSGDAERVSSPLAFARHVPAPLADDGPATAQHSTAQQSTAPNTRRQAAPQDVAAGDEGTVVETFHFRLSSQGASTVAQSARPTTQEPSHETGDVLQAGPGLELRTADESALTTAPQTSEDQESTRDAASVDESSLAGSPSAESPPDASTVAEREAPLAMRLDALHPSQTSSDQKIDGEEIADLEGSTPRARRATATPDDNEVAALPDEATEASATPAVPPQPAPRAIKGSIVHFDRGEQTVRLMFGGAEPPPVGSMVQVQHTGLFGSSEVTTLRVVRVDGAEVLARATNHSRLQRLARGDQAFYRPAATPAGKVREPHMARSHTTTGVWK